MNSRETQILIVTTLVFILLCVLYYRKKTNFKVGLYILMTYTLSSAMSMVYVMQPYSWAYLNGKGTWWPIAYWMVLFLITCIPIFNFDKSRITKIDCDLGFLYKICVFGFVVSIIPFFEQILLARSSLGGGIDAAVELHDNAEDAMANLSFISKNLLRINIAIYDLSFIALLILFLQKKKNRFIMFCAVFVIVTRNLTGLVAGHRSSFIELMQKMILILMIAFPLVDEERRKKMKKVIVVMFAIVLPLFFIITIGRTMAYSEQNSNFTLIAYLSRYMGEQFLLFNEYLPIMKEPTGGLYTCWYLLDIFGFNPPEMTYDYYYGDLKRLQGIPQNVFYTFIGNFVQDFGFVIAFIWLTIVSIFFSVFTRFKNNCIPVSTLYMFIFYASIIMRGVISYPYNGSHGKFVIFAFIIYFILKGRESKKAIT